MRFGRPSRLSSPATAFALALLLSGCVAGPVAPRGEQAGFGAIPQSHPEVTQAELAARPEPRSTAEVAAIEAELALIARRRAVGTGAGEMAALEARARELQRLVAAERAESLRR